MPKKSLKLNQLSPLGKKDDHLQSVKVKFTDSDGKQKVGFYTSIEVLDNSSLVAMISVACYIRQRMTCTDTAELMLVLNEQGQIAGTVSFDESQSKRHHERELNGGSRESLPRFNFADELVVNLLCGNDDVLSADVSSAQANDLELMANPVLSLVKTITFQEQVCVALLKEFMVFDHDILREGLEDYLGGLPFECPRQPSQVRDELETCFPLLFYPEANSRPFVDLMVEFFRRKYEEIYGIVISPSSCEKNVCGVPVLAFNQYLHKRPTAYCQILEWGEKNNYNRAKLEQRYRQIHRDAYAPTTVDCSGLPTLGIFSKSDVLISGNPELQTPSRDPDEKSLIEMVRAFFS